RSLARYRANERNPWKTVVRWGPEDAQGELIDFTADGNSLWLNTSEGRDTLSVVKRNLVSGKETLIASDPASDAREVWTNPVTREVEAVIFDRERRSWKILDPRLVADLANLRKGARGEPSIISYDGDFRT